MYRQINCARVTGLLLFFITVVLASKEKLLLDKLFKSYNKNVRPVLHRNTAVEVIIHMYTSGFVIDDVNLMKGTVAGRMRIQVIWKDQFLSWNASDYEGVDGISIDTKDIWLPDLVFGNAQSDMYMLDPENQRRALIWEDGTVKIYPLLYMDIGFDVSIYKYPFDVHDCVIQISSSSYANKYISIKFSGATDSMLKRAQQTNGQWDIVNVRVENKTLETRGFALDKANYYFTLKRKWLYYVLNIMGPVAITSALNSLCFTLPSDSGERITLCISIYLTLAVFLNVVNSALPETSDEQSILSIYIGLQFLASTFTTIMTVITLKLYHRDNEISNSVPCSITSHKMRQTEFTEYQTERTDTENCNMMKNEISETANRRSWKRFADMLNTACCLLSVAWNIGLIIAIVMVARSQ